MSSFPIECYRRGTWSHYGWYRTRRKKWRQLVVSVILVSFILWAIFGYEPQEEDSSEVPFSHALGPRDDTEFFFIGTSNGISLRHLLASNQNISVADRTLTNYPTDLFSREQRKQGAIILHILGLAYMFVALAIVCDEFFIPALDVITEKTGISEDVAGATFMAAGGSAPELFTSLIGLFVSQDNVGIGTIVGSAVFNILFVISMCAIFSKTVLELTWWPLFRDVTFYSLILITLILCFLDSKIYWYEALILLLWYFFYVSFMKYNEKVENFVKRCVNRGKVNQMNGSDQSANGENGSVAIPPVLQLHVRKMSMPLIHGGSSKFRQGVLQLMIHTIDPLHEEVVTGMTISASTSRPQSAAAKGVRNQHVHPPGATECTLCSDEPPPPDPRQSPPPAGALASNGNAPGSPQMRQLAVNFLKLHESNNNPAPVGGDKGYPSQPLAVAQYSIESEKDTEEPLDVSWPKTGLKRVTYIILAPIIIPLWLTLPDVRRPEKRNFFPGSFLGSILWIGFFSYLMVWWATLVGDTFGINPEVMGLTFLAAGTSIPDLITSVLVARKGLGDMAVSSSVGSNIFDVTVGLPFPWLLYTMIFGQAFVSVDSTGMACSILILFAMLMFVIITIAAFKWKLNISMAVVMFLLYFVFIALSLLLNDGTIKCGSTSKE